eukprot:3921126-Pleurochrysis_carterae.AAC.1
MAASMVVRPAPRQTLRDMSATPRFTNRPMPAVSFKRISLGLLSVRITPFTSTCSCLSTTTRDSKPYISPRTKPKLQHMCDVSWPPSPPC